MKLQSAIRESVFFYFKFLSDGNQYLIKVCCARKPALTVVGIRCADHATPSIGKSWHYLCRQAAVARSV
jgi:hypothetical protein